MTFIAGIFIHALILHYPLRWHRQWSQECEAYLQEKQMQIVSIAENFQPHRTIRKKASWQYYLPFIGALYTLGSTHKRRIFTLDILLFIFSLLIFHQFDSYLYWGSGLLFTWLLVTSSFIDAEHQLLPDELTYLLLWLGLIASCWNIYTDTKSAILGAFAAYSLLWILSFLFKQWRKKEGIGHGDLKLLAAITAWTGILQISLILFLASTICLLFILLRRLFCDIQFSAPIAFGPFLGFAGWLALLWGNKIVYHLLF